MTKIKTIYVRNIRAINEENLNLNGATVIVVGGNNKGKTTLLTAFINRLRGIKDERVIKQGEREGKYVIELSNGEKLMWDLKPGKNGLIEKMTLITERNIPTSITKEIAQYYFPPVFNVDKFLNETPAEQRKILEKICGLDFSEVNKAYAAAYEERTWANKKLIEAKAKEILFEPHWKQEPQDVAIATLEKELNGIEAHNLRNKMVVDGIATKSIQLTGAIKFKQELEEQLEKIKLQIAETEQHAMQLETEIDKGNNWLKEEKNKPKDKTVAENLKATIEDLKQNNLAIEMQAQLTKAEENAQHSENEIKRIIADKEEMIRLGNLPAGFGFNDFGITYNGLPFDKKNLSSSAIYIAALKLATLGLGEVRAIHFDASFLDKNSLMEVNDWAEENNLQLLIERPDYEGGEISYEIIENDEWLENKINEE